MSPAQPPKGRGPQPPPRGQGGRPQPQPQRGQPQRPPAKPQKLEVTKLKTPDQVHFACPACGRPFSMKAQAAGRKAKCPCGARIMVPPPGGVPRPIWMPSAEVIKKAQQQWKTSGADKNPSEIALETSTGTKVMIGGLIFAAVAGGLWWKKQQDAAAAANQAPVFAPDTGGAGSPEDALAGDLANLVKSNVVGIEALDPSGAVTGSGSCWLVAESTFATSAWLIVGAQAVRVRFPDGSTYAVSAVEGLDLDNDVALLRLEGTTLRGILLDESGEAESGQPVHLGSPGRPATNVVLSRRALREPLAQGQVGSPLVGSGGKVVGVAVQGPDGAAAAPASAVAALLAKRSSLPLPEALALSPGRAGGVARMAARLLACGRTLAAVRILRTAADAAGAPEETVVELAELLVSVGRPREAARRLAGIPSPAPSTRIALAIARLEAGADTEALSLLRAAGSGGGEARLQAALALALARLGDGARARACAERVLVERTAAPAAIRLAALAFATLRDADGEGRALSAHAQAGADAGARAGLKAEVALARGDAAASEKAWAEAESQAPAATCAVGRARALLALGNLEGARTGLSRIPAGIVHEDGCLLAARTWIGGGEEAAARGLEALKPLLASDPDDADANELAARLLAPGDPAGAAQHWEAVVRARPHSEAAALSLCSARIAAGDPAEGAVALAAFLGAHPDAHRTRIELAALKAPAQPEEALKLLDAAPSTGALAGRAAYARGLALLALNRSAEAFTAFSLAVSHDPAAGEYRWQRAVAAEGQNIHEARAFWESYIAWGKANGEPAERIAAAEKRLLLRFGR